MTGKYDPERSVREMRDALLVNEPSFREINDIMVRAAAKAEGDLWPDPALREAAGMGALTAAASISSWPKAGGEAAMVNAVGMFGLALVDSARDELRRTGARS